MTQAKYELKLKQLTDLLDKAKAQGNWFMARKIATIIELLTIGYHKQGL